MCNTNKIEVPHGPEFMQNYTKISNIPSEKKILKLESGFKNSQKSINFDSNF